MTRKSQGLIPLVFSLSFIDILSFLFYF